MFIYYKLIACLLLVCVSVTLLTPSLPNVLPSKVQIFHCYEIYACVFSSVDICRLQIRISSQYFLVGTETNS